MTETDRRADVPEALKPLVARIVRDAGPLDIWLFGSRARGERGATAMRGDLDAVWHGPNTI